MPNPDDDALPRPRRRALGRGPGAAPAGPGSARPQDPAGPARPPRTQPGAPGEETATPAGHEATEDPANGEERPGAPALPDADERPGPEETGAAAPDEGGTRTATEQAAKPGPAGPGTVTPEGERSPGSTAEAGTGAPPRPQTPGPAPRGPAPGPGAEAAVRETDASPAGDGAAPEARQSPRTAPAGEGVDAEAPEEGPPRPPGEAPEGPGAHAEAPEPRPPRPPGEAPEGEGAAEDDGRFTVVLDNFEGPFDLLLQLISKHKLDVTEVALSRVTDEFMAHIHAMGPDWDLDQTTEFLVVAATLLDLKAARLLPAAEVEDEADLALLEARDLLFARLLQYRAYKEVAGIFAGRLAEETHRHPRTVGLEPHHAELLPEVVLSIGPEGFAKLAVKAMQPKPKPQVYVEHIHAPLVSVREQAEVLVARLRELGEAGFRTLVEDAPDTLTVVARFLALLELYRERAVALDQDEPLGSLTVRWSGGEGAEPLVTDEFDRPPAAAAEGAGPGTDEEEAEP